jgi:hypothetical protein
MKTLSFRHHSKPSPTALDAQPADDVRLTDSSLDNITDRISDALTLLKALIASHSEKSAREHGDR